MVGKRLFVIIVVLVGMSGAIYWFLLHKPSASKIDSLDILGLAALKIEQAWREQGKQIDLRCHPMFFEEYLKENPEITIITNGEKHLVSLQKNANGNYLIPFSLEEMRWHSEPFFAYKLKLKYGPKEASIFFNERCREVYLPQRRYAYGLETDQYRHEWSNFKRHIYIDKFLVKKFDIKLWLEKDPIADTLQVNPKAILPPLEAPATELTASQMQRYCGFKGKQLLSAQILDAASFHPLRLDDVNHPGRGEYVWTKNKSLSFLYKARQQHNFNFNADFCRFLFTRECIEQAPDDIVFAGIPSWMGLFNVLGGPLEYVTNGIDPKHNLKASSFYFTIDSPWHQVAKRAFWDGKGHTPAHFDWNEIPPENEQQFYQVGFRCMRYVYE